MRSGTIWCSALLVLIVAASCAPAQAPSASGGGGACMRWIGERGLARTAEMSGDERACVAHFAAATRDGADCAGDAYLAARCHARLGHNREALDQLERAVRLGYRTRDALEGETDFEPLRHDDRWAGIVAGASAREAEFKRSVDPELLAIYLDDQADRDPTKATERARLPGTVAERDKVRRERVRAAVEAGRAKTSADFFHAAMVFQHGVLPDEIAVARDLAQQAVKIQPPHPSARWLVAASTDRLLMFEDRPQRYATQFRTENGEWVLYEQDPTVTDEERAQWDAPPLAVARLALQKLRKTTAAAKDDGAR